MCAILIAIDSDCEMSEEENTGGVLLCIDQEKVFDRVNHKYLFRILEKMKIQSNSLVLVEVMCESIQAK